MRENQPEVLDAIITKYGESQDFSEVVSRLSTKDLGEENDLRNKRYAEAYADAWPLSWSKASDDDWLEELRKRNKDRQHSPGESSDS